MSRVVPISAAAAAACVRRVPVPLMSGPLHADKGRAMPDNVDRRLLDHWKQMRRENAEEHRFLRLVETELRTNGSSAYALEEQVTRARRHVQARRQSTRLARVIQLHAFD